MSTISKLIAGLALIAGLSGCMQNTNPAVANAAAGAALGATVAGIAGGSRSDIAATALVGAIGGAAISQ